MPLLDDDFFAAATAGDLDLMHRLHAQGANPAALSPGRGTALSQAARAGHLDCVQALLNWAPEAARFVDNHCNTPLILSVWNGHADCAQALLPFSDPLACDEMGVGLLSICTLHDNDALLQLLLPLLDPRAKDNQQQHALSWALNSRAHRCTRILVDHCDLRGSAEATYLSPLYKAVCQPDSDGLSILLQALRRHPPSLEEQALARAGSMPQDETPASILGLSQKHVDVAFEAACRGHYWACADLLSASVSEAKLRDALDGVDVHNLPGYAARLERQALMCALALPSTAQGSTSDSTTIPRGISDNATHPAHAPSPGAIARVKLRL